MLVFIGSLIVLAFSAALVVPYFVDWSQYTARFEEEASKVLGRQVTVNGDVTARLFPFPSVRFTDVAVAGREAAAPPAMTVDAFSMDAELAPFLSGEILIFDMRVEGARALATVAEDGSVDWAIRPDTPFDPAQITLENITITGGELRLIEEGPGREHAFTDLDLTVRADTLEGPWRVAGNGVFDGAPAEIAVTTGRVNEEGQMRLRATLRPQAFAIRLESEGQVRLDNNAPRYDGSVSILSEARGEDGTATPSGDGRAARLTGAFSADHHRIAIDEFRFETGPADAAYAATGSALIDLGENPDFVIEAHGDQVRVDAPADGDARPGDAARLADRFKAISQVLADTPQFPIPGTVNLDLPAIVAGETTIRSIKVSARPNGNLWEIDSATAELPGRTIVEASGRLVTGAATSFEGKAVVASRQLSGLAAWLGPDVDERVRQLGAAGASAEVYLSAGVQSFRNLELIAGTTRLIGLAERLSPDDAEATITLRLSGETVDLQSLQAIALLVGGEKESVAFARTHNIDLALKADTLVNDGVHFDKVNTSMRLRGERLEVDRFSVGAVAGAALGATATVNDPFGTPSGNADISILSSDLQEFIDLAAERSWMEEISRYLSQRGRAYPGMLEDAQINAVIGVAGGKGASSITGSLSGIAGGTDMSATVTLSEQAEGAPLQDTQISLNNPNAAPLMALAGIDALPFDLGRPLAVDVTIGGRLSDGLQVEAALEGGDTGVGEISATATRGSDGAVSAEGELLVTSDDIEDYLVLAGVSLPGMGLGLPVDLKLAFSGTRDDFALDGITGRLGDAEVEGELVVARVTDPASPSLGLPMVTGRIKASDADLVRLGEVVVGATAIAGDDGALFATDTDIAIAADVAMDVAEADLGRLGIVRDALFSLGLARDGVELRDLSGRYRGAALDGTVSLKNNTGAGLLSASGSWKGVDLDTLFAGADGSGATVSGTADIAGSISATGRSIEGLIAGLAGSGTITARELVLPGLNAQALAPILAAADPLGIDLDEATARAIALEALSAGPFEVGDLASAFTIAAGVMRLPPLIVDKELARLRFDARRDFNDATIEAGGEIEYKPDADDELSGAQPRVGFAVTGTVAEPAVSYDPLAMVQYLTQRALEREQVRVAIMQAVLLEKQQMRREMRLMAALSAQRERVGEMDRMADLEAARLAEELARLAAEEAARKADEEAARKAAEEARLQAEEDARRQAAEEAERRAAEEARRRAEDEARREAEEVARQKAIEEARRLAEEEQARLQRLRQEEAAPADDAQGEGGTSAATAPPSEALPRLEFKLPGIADPADSF